jgi:hypothetical protein
MIFHTISNNCATNEYTNDIINNNCAHAIWLIVQLLLSQFRIEFTTIHLTITNVLLINYLVEQNFIHLMIRHFCASCFNIVKVQGNHGNEILSLNLKCDHNSNQILLYGMKILLPIRWQTFKSLQRFTLGVL